METDIFSMFQSTNYFCLYEQPLKIVLNAVKQFVTPPLFLENKYPNSCSLFTEFWLLWQHISVQIWAELYCDYRWKHVFPVLKQTMKLVAPISVDGCSSPMVKPKGDKQVEYLDLDLDSGKSTPPRKVWVHPPDHL